MIWAPLVLTAVLALLAFLTPPQVPFTRLLPAAPALAASLWSVAATLALGVVCLLGVVAYALVTDHDGTFYTAGAIAAVTLAAAYASHLRLQREDTLAEVRAVADTTQRVLLRPVPRRIGCLEIETLYVAAAPQARVGGDFYAVVDTAYGVRLIIGDVRGKGLDAVGVASAVLGSFREAAYDAPDLGGLARRLDTTVGRYEATAPAPDSPELFATAVLAEIPAHGAHARILSCGHPPVLLTHDGHVRPLTPGTSSPPINLATLLGGVYHVEEVPFVAGDQLLLYTDGVTETRDGDGAFFPLAAWAGQRTSVPPRTLLDHLYRALVRHSEGKLNDDIAVLAVRTTPRPAPRAASEAGVTAPGA
ncbi:PP2C family protein-serine/threonine phosphatase [Streptomyces sp. SID3212]|uniref:PP2C family protein-serine/threonine phosphatase n=1 Tax=Streptomyces sp. SID3212 TaxID=2690259 RepID=UPI00136F4F6A|nr:PP2C family protein-serine/threonine phosphatase [Streptomyces sp. SID3212]MYV56111.1 SpoIIE family protein phosphatase [Streptomyces sp. SID3212]